METNKIFRAKGTYKASGRKVWLTKSWKEEKVFAELGLTNSRFTDVEIIEADEYEMNKAGKVPQIMRSLRVLDNNGYPLK